MARNLEHLQQVRFFQKVRKQIIEGDERFELIFAVPNGGLRHPRVAAALKAEGVKAGVPDIFFAFGKGGFHGMFIEMKYGKNAPTTLQKDMMEKLGKYGFHCVVCYSADEAMSEVEKYLRL